MPESDVPIPGFHTVANAVGQSVLATYEDDRVLFKDIANERSILFHVGRRLTESVCAWPGRWWVDLEYNRWHKPSLDVVTYKYLELPQQSVRRVFPDLVIHDRSGSSSEHNLLVLEAKHRPSREDRKVDYVKLRAFRVQFSYRYAVFLEFPGKELAPCWRWVYDTPPDPSETPPLVATLDYKSAGGQPVT